MSKKSIPPSPSPQTLTQTQTSDEAEEDYIIANTEPPPYSSPVVSLGPSRSLASTAAATRTPWLPNLDFSKCSIPDCTVSKDGTVVMVTNPRLSKDSKALTRFIQEQASLPPLPCIRIVGSSSEEGWTKPDFDIKLNMLRFFLPSQSNNTNNPTPNVNNNAWNYIKLVGENELAFRGKDTRTTSPTLKSLEQWAWKFCHEDSSVKTFVLQRQITNWNTSFIEGQIRSLIAAMGYTRHVSVTFPVQYTQIVVQPPRSGSEGFFTSLFAPKKDKKRYEVVHAVWPYASLPPGVEAQEAGRVCAVQTEEAWWRDWKDVLRLAIVGKRHGWLSLDDLLYYKMLPVEPEIPKNPWGY